MWSKEKTNHNLIGSQYCHYTFSQLPALFIIWSMDLQSAWIPFNWYFCRWDTQTVCLLLSLLTHRIGINDKTRYEFNSWNKVFAVFVCCFSPSFFSTRHLHIAPCKPVEELLWTKTMVYNVLYCVCMVCQLRFIFSLVANNFIALYSMMQAMISSLCTHSHIGLGWLWIIWNNV